MSPDRIDAAYFSPDIREFIGALDAYGVRYVIVGGEAVIYYGLVRRSSITGTRDIPVTWIFSTRVTKPMRRRCLRP